MKRLVIKLPIGYITGFCEEHQIIQVTEDKCSAKTFGSIDEVEDFINDYADVGYGFQSSNYVLEDV